MKLIISKRDMASGLLSLAFALSLFAFTPSSGAQETGTDAAESMGVGMKSRFASGATPITIERTKIVPGTPMSVNSTMSNILTSNSGSSFGGILARYDTSNFGKFFGTGSLPERTPSSSSRVDALTDLAQTDNEIENVEIARMYPPRLSIDFNDKPTRLLTKKTPESIMATKGLLKIQIETALQRYGFDQEHETLKVVNVGDKIYLRGKVKLEETSRLLANILAINFGGDAVVNELVVEGAEVRNLDLFGRPLHLEEEERDTRVR